MSEEKTVTFRVGNGISCNANGEVSEETWELIQEYAANAMTENGEKMCGFIFWVNKRGEVKSKVIGAEKGNGFLRKSAWLLQKIRTAINRLMEEADVEKKEPSENQELTEICASVLDDKNSKPSEKISPNDQFTSDV